MTIMTAEDMRRLGEAIGRQLHGGENIELIGDVGAGKTTLTKGIARGLGVADNITSPSFTISCNYSGRDGLIMRHYDFYRLNDPGIMSMELAESLGDKKSVNIVEWADSVKSILPDDRITVRINYLPEAGREVQISGPLDQTRLMN